MTDSEIKNEIRKLLVELTTAPDTIQYIVDVLEVPEAAVKKEVERVAALIPGTTEEIS